MARNTVYTILERLIICEPSVLPTGCWIYPGCDHGNGYRRASLDGWMQYVHRVVYVFFCGAIPDGLELDHLCRNRACANFEHVEPVTRKVNILRGEMDPGAPRRNKTHCPYGHPYSGDNLRLDVRGYRACWTCIRQRRRERRRRLREYARSVKQLHGSAVEGQG